MSPVCTRQAAARRVARRGAPVVGGEEEGPAGAVRMRLAAARALGRLGCCLPSSARLALVMNALLQCYKANPDIHLTNMLLCESRPHHTMDRNRAWWLCARSAA